MQLDFVHFLHYTSLGVRNRLHDQQRRLPFEKFCFTTVGVAELSIVLGSFSTLPSKKFC